MDLQKEVEIKYKIQQLYQLRDKEHTANKLDKQAKLQSLMTETRAQVWGGSPQCSEYSGYPPWTPPPPSLGPRTMQTRLC